LRVAGLRLAKPTAWLGRPDTLFRRYLQLSSEGFTLPVGRGVPALSEAEGFAEPSLVAAKGRLGK